MSGTELHPASYWRPEDTAVRCELCPHRCLISEGKRGLCKVREHQKGRLFALTYGKVSAVQFDPVEKKPLYHFHPGKPILSIGSVGCNFHCGFCQNHHLVECAVPLAPVPVPDLVRAARREGAVGISYTYNEPLIWFEFVVDCAREFRKAGMANVLVTNGFVSPEPLAELLPLVDAMNIDLKSMDPEFYRRICGGSLAPVLATFRGVDPLRRGLRRRGRPGNSPPPLTVHAHVSLHRTPHAARAACGGFPDRPGKAAVRLCGELSSGGGRGHCLPGMRGDRRQEKPVPHRPFRSYGEPVCLLLRIPPFHGIKYPMNAVPAPRLGKVLGAAFASLLLFLSLMTAPPLPVRADNVIGKAGAYEERTAAEKSTRSRFRRLEVASLVLILAAGGAAIFWVVRRK
jgi:hypothetical protein